MDVPDEDALKDENEENHDEDSEEVGLVVQDVDGLLRRADLGEPVELTHCVGCFAVLGGIAACVLKAGETDWFLRVLACPARR